MLRESATMPTPKATRATQPPTSNQKSLTPGFFFWADRVSDREKRGAWGMLISFHTSAVLWLCAPSAGAWGLIMFLAPNLLLDASLLPRQQRLEQCHLIGDGLAHAGCPPGRVGHASGPRRCP